MRRGLYIKNYVRYYSGPQYQLVCLDKRVFTYICLFVVSIMVFYTEQIVKTQLESLFFSWQVQLTNKIVSSIKKASQRRRCNVVPRCDDY